MRLPQQQEREAVMATTVTGGPVKDHAQAFADETNAKFGTTFTTYNGHSPTKDRALDSWDSPDDLTSLCKWAEENWERFGIDYMIWQQRIWNPEILRAWRHMAWRAGANDPNHLKHAHFSFELTGEATPRPTPQAVVVDPNLPMLAMGDKGNGVRYLQERLVAHGHNVMVDGDFGPHTRARVQIHQAAWRLVPDGIVGPKTWPSLLVNI